MAIDPEYYRAARLAIPRLPLPAILGFALLGVGGSVFLGVTSYSNDGFKFSAATPKEVPVYEARAVLFDSPPEAPAQRAAAIAEALTATQIDVRRETEFNPDQPKQFSEPALFSDSDRELRSFPGFPNFLGGGGSVYLVATGTTFGISAQTAPSGFAAPDAEMLVSAPVPETSTWLCGGALFLLVAARGARAHWYRKRRRDS
jgi:hypothetical protein